MSKLSNADFRAIYETNRAVPSSGPGKEKRKSDELSSNHKPKKFKPASKRPMPQTLQEQIQDYRDRAKERRSGANEEYPITEDQVKGLSIEESKFLGGDMEHTHLVKGLDFALLAKIRADLETKEAQDAQKAAEKSQGPASLVGLEARTPLGKFVRSVMLAEGKDSRNKFDLFLPGRTTFSYDLDDEFGSEIPTTISRSLEDLPYSTRDKKTALINKNIMSSISTIMAYLRQGSRPMAKKVKKKEHHKEEKKPAVHTQSAQQAVEDDIFDDAGTYDLSMRAAQQAAHQRR